MLCQNESEDGDLYKTSINNLVTPQALRVVQGRTGEGNIWRIVRGWINKEKDRH